MNSINIIVPYRYEGLWVFDDPARGLDKEAFVAGADAMLDIMAANIPNADAGFVLIFAATPFPGHHFHLEWQRGDETGNWYREAKLEMEGWLCPALFKYFETAPKEIFVQIRRKSEYPPDPTI